MAYYQQQYQCLTILLMSFSLTSGSYLGYPRINFAGFFRADVNTRNNERCNYLPNYDPGHADGDWNINGTNEFEWFENKVTSVFRQNGAESKNDPIIGKHVMSNLKRPFAKIVDMDIDAGKATIYGMKFGIAERLVNPEENILLFFGNWTRFVIGQDMWSRIACYSSRNTGGEPFQDDLASGASATSFITDIIWNGDLADFPVLEELKTASDAVGGTLSVRVTLSYYTTNLPSSAPHNFTLGYVMGTIGIPSPTDTLNVGGERVLVPVSGSVPVGYKDTLKSDDLCYEHDLSKQTWVSKAPFEVDAARKEVRVDFSNAFTVDLLNTLTDIGSLNLAISHEDGCVRILTNGAIPYLTEDWLQTYSGILTVSLEAEELINLQDGYALLVVQVYDNSNGDTSNICGDFLSTGKTDAANVLSRELEYFIRPRGYYVDRLSRGETSEITFYVTHYGDPATDTYIRLVPAMDSLPKNGIIPDQYIKQVSDGTVNFTFLTADKAPPLIRKYPKPFYCKGQPHMTLPVEGNVYVFAYQHCTSSDFDTCSSAIRTYTPTFLFFSDIADVPDDKVNWVDHVGPVLSQYAQVSPIMNYILDMSNYTEVIEPHNRELIKLALERPITDPGHMPTTRDLSPKRRAMILAWLNQSQPLYDSKGTMPPPVESIDKCVPPPKLMRLSKDLTVDHERCGRTVRLSGKDHPLKLEPYYESLLYPDDDVSQYGGLRMNYMDKGQNYMLDKDRPLMGLLSRHAQRLTMLMDDGEGSFVKPNKCQIEALRVQLQTAIAVEFATIPVYLTTLYSIVDGCNQEIYNRIRSVVMQEMIHMAQVANILIALGGDPVIDSPDFVHNYPTKLPGDILPGLTVSLQKLSLPHVKKVLMGIETPAETDVVNPSKNSDEYTIGAFYEEISTCISDLGDSIFKEPREDRQVLWPWTPSDKLGEVIKITNVQEAKNAINMIVEQGEGTSKVDPTTESSDDLAHFFKFEEIVCQKELVYKQADQTYSYSGDDVPFNADGVWNMRDNPQVRDIQPHTNCYVEAKAFHGVFRNLLRNLNDTFNGYPERVTDTVLLMESLHVHAKKTMWTKFTPDSAYTCGPVWNYHWTTGVD